MRSFYNDDFIKVMVWYRLFKGSEPQAVYNEYVSTFMSVMENNRPQLRLSWLKPAVGCMVSTESKYK